MDRHRAQTIIEAILFTMGESVELKKLAEVIEEEVAVTKEIIEELMNQYKEENRGISILELDGAYQMCTNGEMYEYLVKIAKTPRKYVLTETVLETLSIIAYKQPVTRLEIEKIRGVSCDHAVNRLIELELIQELGRLDAPGRPLLFGTSEQFLRSFGLSSIKDLPILNPELVEDFRLQAEEEAHLKIDV